MDFDSIIIGAGASGLMAAYEALARGRKVLLIDHRRDFAQKLLISGGGRCNFTNSTVEARSYLSENPDFVRSALARFQPANFLSILDAHRIAYVEEEGGKLFLKGSSKRIFEMLLSGVEARGGTIAIGRISSVRRGDGFSVRGEFGEARARSLVLATGGLSYPALGASDLGYRIAKQFGHRVIPCRPGLVPLVFAPRDRGFFSKLAGISFRAEVAVGKSKIEDECLITHRGLSGPAILRASLLWDKGQRLLVDALPGVDLSGPLEEKREAGSRMQLKNFLSHYLPDRLADALCERLASSRQVGLYSKKELARVIAALHSIRILPAKTEGYARAEVTLGGVDTRELSSKNMESRLCPGLYFIGEVMDVTGDLGGFNLHWAWASAHAAANAI
ncbi:MAG: aminoacetone oxidase family FAD-binding enzyme [bacterium]